ncbi:MAG: glycosyltransferase family 1 protein [Cytophagales bacterium]|nr:MAG: glycosyltransferase family 1 protein [Cytophagales bacterium]
MKESIDLLAIPNFYSSYYVLGLSKVGELKYRPEKQFQKFNNRGFVIFRYKGKIGVIDNHDPVGVDQELYQACDAFFATNKLLNHTEYSQPKVKPLFPHYPVNILSLYFRLFGVSLLTQLKPRDLAREIYVLRSRPVYAKKGDDYHYTDYVFFSGSTWKKEAWANQIRAEFIRACKADPRIRFEGGFIPRSDGNNFGFDQELNKEKYSPKRFSELSAQSLLSLNNPAVLGAVSWRLAEYWNSSSFVISFPFATDLPRFPIPGEEIHQIKDSSEYSGIINRVLDHPEYHEKIARGGKRFFDTYCTPESQAKYILAELNH